MTFTESIKICLQKYIDFNGRAARPEFWWFALVTLVVGFIPIIGWLIRLALLLPSLSVQARRLHDMNRSAWWLLLLVPPITPIGGIILLIMSAFPGTLGPNRYGPNPQQAGRGGYGQEPPGYPYAQPPPAMGSYDESPYDAGPAGFPPDSKREARQYCTQCGMQLQEGAQFCSGCGTSA